MLVLVWFDWIYWMKWRSEGLNSVEKGKEFWERIVQHFCVIDKSKKKKINGNIIFINYH